MSNLDRLLRLSDISSGKDIRPLSDAIFPGTHCPLFGVGMISSFVEDLVVVVIGTEECTYYAKNFAYGRQKGRDNFYSLVVGENEITFGAEDKLKEAIRYIDKKVRPKAIMLVTTCVLEVIGEDVGGLKYELEDEIDSKLLVVKTEHFKCKSHIPGMEDSLKELVELMDECEKNNSVNIIGHRQHDVEDSELFKVLSDSRVEINAIIPAKASVDKLKLSSKAKLNIVNDSIGLPLAVAMEERFEIPYVEFGRSLSLEKIRGYYEEIEEALQIDILNNLEQVEEGFKTTIARAKDQLGGKSFIYGNTPLNAFEVTSFLSDLGLEPLLIQARDFYDGDEVFINEILKDWNPHVARIANIEPLRSIYDEKRPDIYVGHEMPMELHKRGIAQFTADDVIKKSGFEMGTAFLEKLIMMVSHTREEVKRYGAI